MIHPLALSLYSAEKSRVIAEIQTSYETEKKEMENQNLLAANERIRFLNRVYVIGGDHVIGISNLASSLSIEIESCKTGIRNKKLHYCRSEKWTKSHRSEVDQEELLPNLSISGASEVTTTSGHYIILLIEDNSELRQFIKAIFPDEYQVVEASNGREGLSKVRQLIPDLVICDIMMPEMDGHEVLGAIRAEEMTSHIPVILLTAKSTMSDRISGIRLGADDYITKPFVSEELIARSEALIESRILLRTNYRAEDWETSPRQR